MLQDAVYRDQAARRGKKRSGLSNGILGFRDFFPVRRSLRASVYDHIELKLLMILLRIR